MFSDSAPGKGAEDQVCLPYSKSLDAISQDPSAATTTTPDHLCSHNDEVSFALDSLTDPVYACNQAHVWSNSVLSGDLDVLSHLDMRNKIDDGIAHNKDVDVYTKAAALTSSPLKAHVF